MEENLFNGNKDEYFEGYINYRNGTIGGLQEYYWCTGYLKVSEEDIVIFPMKAPNSLGACYDADKKYIKGIIPADLDGALNYSISAGVSYIRVSIEKGRVNKNISNFILNVIYKNSGSEETLEFNNIVELKEADLQEGSIVSTKGYYIAGDNGAAKYKIMTYDNWYNNILPKDILYIRKGNIFVKTPVDEYGNHTLNNKLIAVIQGDNYTPEQWGAKGDGKSNDNWSFIHMFAYIKTGEIKFRNKATYILGLTEDNPYRLYMCGTLLGGQPFYKPIMANVNNLILDGNDCLITLPDNQFGDSGMGIFNFAQDIENLEIKNFNFDGKGKTMTSINKNSNHTLFYSPGQLYLNVLGEIGYKHYKYDVNYNTSEPNASFKPSVIKELNIHNNEFNDAGTMYKKAGDYGGDFILIINPTELDGLYVEDNKFYNWGRWVFAIDLGGNGERLYNVKFNRNECLGANRAEVVGDDTWKWRALGLIDFESRKCFTNLEISNNNIIGTAGWAFNGNSKISENIEVKNNHWEHIGGGYPYIFEWYSAQVKDVVIEDNYFSGNAALKLGYTTHNLQCRRNRILSYFRLLSISGDIIFENNTSLMPLQKLVSIDALNEPTYLSNTEKKCNFTFRGNIGGIYGDIPKNSDYALNYDINFIIENNTSNTFKFNFFIKNQILFDPNQINKNDIRDFLARGAKFSNPTFSQSGIVASGGGIYNTGEIITTNAEVVGVARTYFFSNDDVIKDFKKYNYNFTSYCNINGIKKLGVRCVKTGFIPSIGNWGFVNQETYFNIVKNTDIKQGAFVYTEDNLYYCINSGKLGETIPTHIEGTDINGDVQLLYITNMGKVEVYVVE